MKEVRKLTKIKKTIYVGCKKINKENKDNENHPCVGGKKTNKDK